MTRSTYSKAIPSHNSPAVRFYCAAWTTFLPMHQPEAPIRGKKKWENGLSQQFRPREAKVSAPPLHHFTSAETRGK